MADYFMIIKKHVPIDTMVEDCIGYVATEGDANYIHVNHNGVDLEEWIEANRQDLIDGVKRIEDFFTISNPVVYGFYIMTNYVDDIYLPHLITNLDNPEE